MDWLCCFRWSPFGKFPRISLLIVFMIEIHLCTDIFQTSGLEHRKILTKKKCVYYSGYKLSSIAKQGVRKVHFMVHIDACIHQYTQLVLFRQLF